MSTLPGEYEELEELLPRSEHAEVLVATANEAHTSIAAEGERSMP